MVDEQTVGQPNLRMVTPLPPVPSGIAQYSAELLNAVDGRWQVEVLPERGSSAGDWATVRVTSASRRRRYDDTVPMVFQLGNSGYHRVAFDLALRHAGVLVLHDVVLHHGRAGELLRTGGGGAYKRLMRERYGRAGIAAAESLLAGRTPADIGDYPLSEDYIERARVTTVHSNYAGSVVLRHVPDANVRVVPMGIALPALIDQAAAREALGLPASAFIVASVTHVNPFKRLHVVLRAFRRVVDAFPESLLVIAGSVSPEVDLPRLTRLFGVHRQTRLLGYVSDSDARLVARSADVSVNLRYPSAGETSASLLRLLGAGRPVLITDDPASAEYPQDAVVRIPVDRFEDEMVSEALIMLATDSRLRTDAGDAARRFIEAEHTIAAAVDGYRNVVESAFGSKLPPVAEIMLDEPRPHMDRSFTSAQADPGPVSNAVADALHDLGLAGHDGTIEAAARAMISIGLDAGTGTDKELPG